MKRCQSPQPSIRESNLATYKYNTWESSRVYARMQDWFNTEKSM